MGLYMYSTQGSMTVNVADVAEITYDNVTLDFDAGDGQ